MQKQIFGKLQDGTEVMLYTLENANGMKAEFINYGAILVSLFVPSQKGGCSDVVLGYDNLEGYQGNTPFFGSTVGPCANRTKGATFSIDGSQYQLDVNDNENNLHSHVELGMHKQIWAAEEKQKGISFTLNMKDGEIGFPGNRSMRVTYTLTEENELVIEYSGESDQKTIFNMTNHSYFNLAGHDSGVIDNLELEMNASNFTPVVKGAIPTGEIRSVIGTPLDFTTSKKIGKDLENSYDQMVIVGGFDHNFVVDDYTGELKKIATLYDEESGRKMETYTDLPGVQLYSANFVVDEKGKNGARYDKHSGICLETQYYPNSANEPLFPDIVFGPERKYNTMTVYKFSW